jgi:hypothetical protein
MTDDIFDGFQPFLLWSIGNIFFFNFGQKIKIKIVLDSHWLGEKEYVY